MNLMVLARETFKATLEANTDYQALLAWPDVTPVLYRTFGEYVAASVPLPYVTIEHYAGGTDLRDPLDTSDSMWKVAVHTEQDEALAFDVQAAMIAALDRQWPVVVNPSYAAYRPINLVYPYFDTVNRQGTILIRAGGIFKLFLTAT